MSESTQFTFAETSDARKYRQEAADVLFAALVVTSLGAYAAGNLLLLNRDVFVATSLIVAPVLAFWAVFYSLSRATGSVLWGACLAWATVWLCCWTLGIGGKWVFAIGAFISAIYTVKNCRLQRDAIWSVAAMAAIAAATAFSSPGVFTFFDNLEWARGRAMHQDVAFHAAITAMIKNHGVVSTGLHGLVETPYYAGLHCFAALVSALSGWGALEVWGVLLYVFCLPLLVFAVTYAAFAIRANSQGLAMMWALSCIMLVVPQLLIDKWLPLRFLYFSETYVVSTALLLLCLPLLGRTDFRWPEAVVATLATGVIAYIKGTSAVFLVGLLGARWFVVERRKPGAGLLALASSAAVLAAVLFGVTKSTEGSHGLTTDILQIVRMGPGGDAITATLNAWWEGKSAPFSVIAKALVAAGLFVALHFMLSWIVLASTVRACGWGSLLKRPTAVLVWSSVLGGLFFAVFFTSSAGVNIWYFTSPSYFVALPVFVAGVCAGLGRFSLPPRDWLMVSLALLIILGTSLKSYYRQSFLAPLRREAAKTDVFVDEMLALRTQTEPDLLLRADKAAWLIEPTYFKDRPIRWSAPLVFVALSERAWIDIIRPFGLADRYPHQDYAFSFYGIDPLGSRVNVAPVVPAGSEVRDWAPSRATLDWEPKAAARIAASWKKIFGGQ
jgi:hypothetical protein